MAAVTLSTGWWQVEGFPTAEEWTALWGLVAALGTLGTLIVAGYAAVVALRQLKQNSEAAKDESRPFVVVDFHFRHGVAMIEVQNVGKTAAHDITFKWDQAPVGDDHVARETIERNLVTGGIPFLAPNRTIRYFFAEFKESLQPRRYRVISYYAGPDGYKWDSVSVLDLDQWARAVADIDRLGELVKEAKAQTRSAQSVVRHTERIAEHLSFFEHLPEVVDEVRERKESLDKDERDRLERRLARMSVFYPSSADEPRTETATMSPMGESRGIRERGLRWLRGTLNRARRATPPTDLDA